MKNRWTRIVVLLAWAPALALAVVLVLWGLIEQQSSLVAPLLSLLRGLPEEIRADPRSYRIPVWTIAYQYFFAFELFFSMILVVLVGPGLISQDLRFNALPLYFSRPLRRLDYFLGKLGVIAFFLVAVAIVPALIAFVLGLGFSLDLTVVKDTGRLFLGSLAYGLVVVVSAGTLMLAISSLSRNSRYVGAIWIGLWIVGNMVSGFLMVLVRNNWCLLFSYTTNLQRIGAALLDTRSAYEVFGRFLEVGGRRGAMADREQLIDQMSGTLFPWYWSAAVLAGLLGLSIWILTFRVKSLDRLK
jgi:ABC-2 type transport system permease protein